MGSTRPNKALLPTAGAVESYVFAMRHTPQRWQSLDVVPEIVGI